MQAFLSAPKPVHRYCPALLILTVSTTNTIRAAANLWIIVPSAIPGVSVLRTEDSPSSRTEISLPNRPSLLVSETDLNYRREDNGLRRIICTRNKKLVWEMSETIL